jgi:hypothetical protein
MTRNGQAPASPEAIEFLFGGDVVQTYHAIAARGAQAWRDNARLTLSIIADNEAEPEEKRLPVEVIYGQAAEHSGVGSKAIQKYALAEERYGDLLDEYDSFTVSLEQLRKMSGRAKARGVEPSVVFLEEVDKATRYGVFMPIDKWEAENRNGATTKPPLLVSAQAAEKNTSRMLRNVATLANDPARKDRPYLSDLAERIRATATRCENLAREIEQLMEAES